MGEKHGNADLELHEEIFLPMQIVTFLFISTL
jgi:hypothetical protein